MPSRVDRYENKERITKRIDKNQELYQERKDYSEYKEITSIDPIIKNSSKSVNMIEQVPQEEVYLTERLSSLYMIDEKKEYDINKVLKTAKEERKDVDSLEQKRKLKKQEYNIVHEIGLKNIEKMKEERPILKEKEKEELKELIDTIYSNTLAQEINEKNQELFSDLMPNDGENTIISEELSQEMVNEERKAKEERDDFDDSFFTNSNKFDKGDLVLDEEEDDEDLYEEESPKWVIIPIILAVLIVVGVLVYLLYKGV